MRKLILIVGVAAVLSGCAGVGGYTPTMMGAAPEHNDRYWPPYNPNSSFPAQIMDGGSHD